jgi:hypothetical protein
MDMLHPGNVLQCREKPGGRWPGRGNYTASLAALTGRARTILRAGFALNVVGSPVKGLIPFRALVAGFLITTNFAKPGSTNAPFFYNSL